MTQSRLNFKSRLPMCLMREENVDLKDIMVSGFDSFVFSWDPLETDPEMKI